MVVCMYLLIIGLSGNVWVNVTLNTDIDIMFMIAPIVNVPKN